MPIERDLSGLVLAGRYRVAAQLGGGGMGTVHAGEHLGVGRKVAIKILRPEAVDQPTAVERFRREARMTARIEHEHVVECLDVGVSDEGLCFYVMEWLRGEDLQTLLRRERTLPWPRARAIVAQVCRALAAAHAGGVVHRDLKPGNIFLVRREDNPDFVKVLDFGIAKLVASDEAPGDPLTRIGEVVGTTPYMAPEMAAGEAFDHRVDVYATGVILFQLLCGRLPYRGRTPRQILVEVLKGELPRMSDLNPNIVASPGMEALLQRALHRDPAQRYADMAALHEALLDLPDDACSPLEATDAGPDPSASESAMAASMLGPISAGRREPASVASPVDTTSATIATSSVAATRATQSVQATSAASSASIPSAANLVDTPGASATGGVHNGGASGEHTLAGPPAVRAARARPWPVLVGLALLLAGGGVWFTMRGPEVTPTTAEVARLGPNEGAVAVESPARLEVATVEPVPVPAPLEVAKAETPPTALARSEEVPVADDAPEDARMVEESGMPAGTRSKKGEPRLDFAEVMRRAGTGARRCLAREGLTVGTRVRFDIAVEARTGRIIGATPREPHQRRASLGACVLEASRGITVRPAPMNEWRRSYEFTV